MRLLIELRHTFRRLRHAGVFTTATTLCLGLGFGVLIVMAAVADAFLLRPLPFTQPDRLVWIWKLFDDESSHGLRYFLAPDDFQFIRQEAKTLRLAAVKAVDVDVLGDGGPSRLSGGWATAELMPLLGVQPELGRWFTVEEERVGAAVVVLASSVWQRHLGGDREALGSSLVIEGRPHTVIGVVSDNHGFPSGTELWMPMRQEDWQGRTGVSAVGRLDDGVSTVAARQEIRALGGRLKELNGKANHQAGLDAEHLQAALVEDLRPSLLGLLAAAMAFLTIALANAGSLAVARSVNARREMAVRQALGAGRAAIVRQAAMEVALLTLAAAGLGLALAYWALPALVAASPVETFSFALPAINGRIMAGTALLALAVATLLSSAGISGRLAALSGGIARQASMRAPRQRKILARLVIADLAVTVVMLVAARHTAVSVGRLLDNRSGLVTENVLTVGVSAPLRWAETHAGRNQFLRQTLAKIETLPKVESAAAVNLLPMTEPEFYWGFQHLDRPESEAESRSMALFRTITPGYLESLGMSVLEGRDLTWSDRHGMPRVLLVNRAFAERHWPGESAIGRRLVSSRGGEPLEVVGVVSNVRERGLENPNEPCLFRPAAQFERRYLSRMYLVIRAPVPLSTLMTGVRQRLNDVDSAAVLFDPRPLGDIVSTSVRRQRFTMLLLTVFAVLALVQAAAGVYGLTTYDISSRARELGVRSALGANRWQLHRLVVGDGLRYAVLGLTLGGLTTFMANRWLDAAWDIGAVEAGTYMQVAGILVAVVIVAAWPAAGRAAGIDPVVSLRA